MMATLGFLDPPKTPEQIERERRYRDDPSTARSSRLVRLVLWGLGIATLAVVALVVTAIVSMITSKQAWLATIRAQYAVESVTLVGGPGRTNAVECWSGSTVHLVARIKNQKVQDPTSTSVAVTLSGELDSALSWKEVEQSIVLSGSAMPRIDDTVEVPFSVEVPAWMANRSVIWTVQATGSGDEPPNRGSRSITVKPCGQGD